MILGLFIGCSPQTPEELYVKGSKAFQQGDAFGATLYFEKFIDKYPEHEDAPKAHLMLARSRARVGDDEMALREYRLVTRQYPDSPEAVNSWFESAGYFILKRQPEEAEKEIQPLIQRTDD